MLNTKSSTAKAGRELCYCAILIAQAPDPHGESSSRPVGFNCTPCHICHITYRSLYVYVNSTGPHGKMRVTSDQLRQLYVWSHSALCDACLHAGEHAVLQEIGGCFLCWHVNAKHSFAFTRIQVSVCLHSTMCNRNRLLSTTPVLLRQEVS